MKVIPRTVQRALSRPVVGLVAALAFVAVPLTSSATAQAATTPHAAASTSSGIHVVTSTTAHRAQHIQPLYSQDITVSIQCATWSGELSWGGNGSILFPAYIDLNGTLKDTCNNGYAQIFLHWDTIDNPKNVLVKKVGANSSAKTPYSTEDDLNTYKDIYLYICSEDSSGYRCSAHKGPGA